MKVWKKPDVREGWMNTANALVTVGGVYGDLAQEAIRMIEDESTD